MSDLYTPSQHSMETPPIRRAQDLVSERLLAAANSTRPWVMIFSFPYLLVVAFFMFQGCVTGLEMAAEGIPQIIGALGAAAFCSFMSFLPAYYLIRYSSALGRFHKGRTVEALEDAMVYQMRYWRFLGLIMVGTVFLTGVLVLLFVGFLGMDWIS